MKVQKHPKKKKSEDPLLHPEKINTINKPHSCLFHPQQKIGQKYTYIHTHTHTHIHTHIYIYICKISDKANGTHGKIDDLAKMAKWR